MKRPIPVLLSALLVAGSHGPASHAAGAGQSPGGAASFTNASPSEVKAFVGKWGPVLKEKGFMAGAGQLILSETNTTVLVSKLLGAVESQPNGAWVDCLKMLADPEHFSTLPPAETLALWKRACTVLEKAAAAPSAEPMVQEALAAARQSLGPACLAASQELELARDTAQRLLAAAQTNGWNYGNIVYDTHSVLGRIALRQGNRPEARKQLRAAGQTPGSPQLNSFGPRFSLARELLDNSQAEDRQAVLTFLDDIATFWANRDKEPEYRKPEALKHKQQVETWKREIAAGQIPKPGFHWP